MNTQVSYFKKVLVVLMAVMMVFTMMPSMAWAVGDADSGSAQTQKGSNKNGYLSNIIIKVGDTLLPNYEFKANQTDYNITITDAQNDLGQGFSMTLAYDDRFNLDEHPDDFDLSTYYNDKKAFFMADYKQYSTAFANKYVPLGETTEFSFELGLVDTDYNFVEGKSDKYYFNVTKIPSLKSLSVTDSEGSQITLTPNQNLDRENTFVSEFTAETKAEAIKLNAVPITDGVKVYVGDSTEPYDANQDIQLASYTTGNTATIPFKLVYEKDGKITENTYTLNLTKGGENFTPVITNQSQNVSCDKDADVTLSVEVQETQGSLSYQWYKSVMGEFEAIENETAKQYKPVTSYPGAQRYKCVVTNTVNGKQYQAESSVILVSVELSYLSVPKIIKQPGTYTYVSETKDAAYDTRYYVGQTPTDLWLRFRTDDGTAKFKYELYYNTANTYDGAIKIEDAHAVTHISRNSTTGTTCDGKIIFPANTTYPLGDHYFFVVLTAYSESDPTLEEKSIKSEIVKLEFVNPSYDFTGAGTEADPYQISNADDLQKLANLVNDGHAMSGLHFKITRDITLPDGWTPMGRTKDGTSNLKNGDNLYAFSGSIDGKINDNTNATITVPAGGKPLLGYVKGAEVKNLNIYGTQIEGAGLVNDYAGVGLEGSAITIDNVRLKTGTKTLKSGMVAAGGSVSAYAIASANFFVTIRNCVIEPGVEIGYTKDKSYIGSFADCINGTIENCESSATVQGKTYVGGILGTMDNAMGQCKISGCRFDGTVTASGDYAGGIAGGGYHNNNSAPNGKRPTILGCTVSGTVEGAECVGGITGGDRYVAQTWDNGVHSVVGNRFSGTVKGSKYVGGIIGYYNSLNKYDTIANNFYTKNCGAAEGIGFVKYVDTNYAQPTAQSGTEIFNTGKTTANCPTVEWCSWRAGYNRTDDPLGKDKEKLAKAVDTMPNTAICYELIMNGTPKTEYYIGDELDFTGVTFTAKWTDGRTTNPTFGTGADQVKATGYNKNSHSIQTVTLSYGDAQITLQVAVKQKESGNPTKDTLTVSFTLLGDSKHDEADQKGGPHGLALNKLDTWLSAKSYEVPLNSTVWDLMQQVQQQNSGVEFLARGSQYGTYIYAVAYNNTTLGEFDNGKLSGWMYTVNGTHPEVGVASRFLNNGDTVVFHYTDDYTKEEGSEKWNTPGGAEEEVKDVTTAGAAGSATTKAPTDVKVSQKTNADGTKETVADVKVAAEHQDEIIKQAAEKKSAEIILEVSAANTKGADSVQLSLEVSFVKNISDKTDADLTVNTENGKVTLDQETIKTVLAEAKGATITLEVTKVAKPTEVQKQAAGANGHLLKLTIKSGDKVISDFNKGKVKVVAEIVSKLLDKKVAAIHIADDGKIEQLAGKVLTIGGKKFYEFTTPHFSTFALVDADELGLDVAEEPQTDVKALAAKLTPIARSAKTAKKNVKVTVSLDKQDKAMIQELKDAGYTVKYRFYRSTKKAAGYKAAVTKKTASYTNTSGKKGTKYFYKVQVRVYDADGKLAAKTALKQCKYATRTWSKAK